MNDVRYAWRSLVRNPLFACGAVATLALGIGVNSTIFTLANRALFSSLPGIAAPSGLAWVSGRRMQGGQPGGMSYLEYIDYRDGSTELFSDLMAFGPASFSLGSGGAPQRIRGHLVSGSYFATLGAVPAAGRLLGGPDDRAGAPLVAVLSYRLWRERFGESEIVGRPIVINGSQVTVVGVAAPEFMGPELGQAADIWFPMTGLPAINTAQARWMGERGTLWLRVMGRMRRGVTTQGAQAALTGLATRLQRAYPDTNEGRTVLVSSASSGVRPSERGELLPIAALLLTVTGLILVIACANVANLLLARGAGRSLELSIRAAVGASRGRLVRQLLTESLVLAVAGAAAGLLLSVWASDLLLARLPELDFRGLHTGVAMRDFLFTALLATASACAFGLAPAITLTRSPLLRRLRETASAGGGRSRLQGIFVITQLSLSLVLLLAAGSSLRALQKSGAMDLGFNPHQLITASYDLTLQNYSADRRDGFRRELLSRIEALPDVTSATVADVPPLSGTMASTIVTTDTGGEAIERRAYLASIGPRYFTTLEIPLVRGRAIGAEDHRGAPGTAVVNETLGRQLWPGSDPLGQMVRFEGHRVQVVGVARDAKYDEPTEDPRPFMYLSLPQHSQLERETVIVRTARGALLAAPLVQAQIQAIDPTLPVFDLRTFEGVLTDRADKQRAPSALFAGFGLLALVLASVGLYGVMAYAASRRTRELGVRLALGSTPGQLVRLLAADGLRLSLTGVAIGVVLALPLAQALGALLFGLRIADLATFAGTCLLLVAVAMLAALLPARRAARVDPIVALRTE
jgi:predicted permease